MKLPKNFGGGGFGPGGFGGMMEQMKSAMAAAQDLEENLKNDRIAIDKGDVKAIFDGTGQLLKIAINPDVVDKDDVEMLEDLVVSTVRAGFEKATEIRDQRVKGIMPNLPDIPGLTG